MGKIKKSQRLEFKFFIDENLDKEFFEGYNRCKIPASYNFEDLLVLRNKNSINDYGIIFQNSNWSKEQTIDIIQRFKNSSIIPIQIFYKDWKNFHVRLGEKGIYRKNKALKNYTIQQINKMIHLRQNEKIEILELGENLITYYQPQTQRLEQSLRYYSPKSVMLDYSHIDNEFAKNSISSDYKIMQEIWEPSKEILIPIINSKGKFTLFKKDRFI